jgi:hypothetical protein
VGEFIKHENAGDYKEDGISRKREGVAGEGRFWINSRELRGISFLPSGTAWVVAEDQQ